MKQFLYLCLILSLLSACAPDTERYKAETPALQPDRFFNGSLTSWGFFQNWRGQAIKRFRMQAIARWNGEHGTMDEHFVFQDGKTQDRHWTFVKTGEHTFTGSAPDVEGDAKGIVYGNTLHWQYTIALPIDGQPQTVFFDDWLYLIDQDHMFSDVTIKKFGLPVGKLTMFFTRID